MKRFGQFVTSLVVGGLMLRAVLRHFDLRQTREALRAAHPNVLILGLALSCVTLENYTDITQTTRYAPNNH